MKKNKILLFSSIGSLLTLPIITMSCNIKIDSKNDNEKKINLHNIANINDIEAKWNNFLKYEYINKLLNIAFKGNEQKINNYINKQKNIDNSYFTNIKDYLYYSSNTTSIIKSDDKKGFFSKKVIGKEKYSQLLDNLYQENWLWFLFNLNKFTFAYFPSYNQFEAPLEKLSVDTQKDSLDLGGFNHPKTNEAIQFVELKEPDNSYQKKSEFFILTKQGIILRLSITTNFKDEDNNLIPEDLQKTKISIFTYSYIYPLIYQNETNLKRFDLSNYVHAWKLFSKGNRTKKILFDDDFGGEPLRFTIVDIDTK
ncbi:hypothetical protein DMC14_000980 [Metamycoplasma phocicerebrale]|uniref:Lipoprotein n=1 Tax=Metamycoplasma phocicerebrale TaxID=142649 RepID=A0A3Q9V973_9BACT|nr:aromatic motif membrane protein [Metamycoplasma phocicerebrale]AZZ65367.1 hypothetical protein DMC14_000980 [Metamycoplasma phocicerebrale]